MDASGDAKKVVKQDGVEHLTDDAKAVVTEERSAQSEFRSMSRRSIRWKVRARSFPFSQSDQNCGNQCWQLFQPEQHEAMPPLSMPHQCHNPCILVPLREQSSVLPPSSALPRVPAVPPLMPLSALIAHMQDSSRDVSQSLTSKQKESSPRDSLQTSGEEVLKDGTIVGSVRATSPEVQENGNSLAELPSEVLRKSAARKQSRKRERPAPQIRSGIDTFRAHASDAVVNNADGRSTQSVLENEYYSNVPTSQTQLRVYRPANLCSTMGGFLPWYAEGPPPFMPYFPMLLPSIPLDNAGCLVPWLVPPAPLEERRQASMIGTDGTQKDDVVEKGRDSRRRRTVAKEGQHVDERDL